MTILKLLVLLLIPACLGAGKVATQTSATGCLSKMEAALNKKLQIPSDFDGTYTYRLQVKGKKVVEVNKADTPDQIRAEILGAIEEIVTPLLKDCPLPAAGIKVMVDTDSDPIVKVTRAGGNKKMI